MREVVIKVNNVSMHYRMQNEKVETFKEYVIRLFNRKILYTHFTALNSINLDIYKGEKIGIIGHNGAGKSTLLKLISGVMKPSDGFISVNGTIAPLLELGAGFDPDLTGAENIFLNGAILGKSEKFLKNRFERIERFAELGDFLNTPIKNYSSGMRAKLGFAIATEIDAEVLILDEVLGVGDESFRRKSSDKIKELINGGKTVILVSHDLNQIEEIADRVVWLENGKIINIGNATEICDSYREVMSER